MTSTIEALKNALLGTQHHALTNYLHVFLTAEGLNYVFAHSQLMAFALNGKVYPIDKFSADSEIRNASAFMQADFKTLHHFLGSDGTEYPESTFYSTYIELLESKIEKGIKQAEQPVLDPDTSEIADIEEPDRFANAINSFAMPVSKASPVPPATPTPVAPPKRRAPKKKTKKR